MQLVTPVPSDTSLFNLGGIGGDRDVAPERSTDPELLVLKSLLPVVKHLPGFTQETNSGSYYFQGELQPSDQRSLYEYTKRIGELTLGAEPDSEARLLHVLARIGQLQDPKKPLFPFLYRLRIVHPSLSLIFLHLLLSSALTTLELSAIPAGNPCYAPVLSFFERAVHQASNLSTLILGPGLIPGQILNISLRYKNIRCLKLLDVGITITPQLLPDIGSLQHLETFVLRDDGTSTYLKPPPLSLFVEAMSQTSSRSDSECSAATDGRVVDPLLICDADGERVDDALFTTLQTLEIHGPLDLIEDLVEKVSSSHLRALSIDVTIPLEGIEISAEGGGPRRKRLRKTASSSQLPQVSDHIMTFLTRSIQKWHNSLVSVNFKNDSTKVLLLPRVVFEDLLLRPDMEHLEVSGMDIASMGDTLCRLEEVEHSKLEFLHLPVHCGAPSIALAELYHIAKACPRLQSFRCPFKNLSGARASDPLSHQLKVLSVNNEEDQITGSWEPKLVREIAHYLDSIFPNIRSITTQGAGGWRLHWRSVLDLVKLCQAVRMEERRRLQGGGI